MSNLYDTRLKIYKNGTSEYVEFKKGLFTSNAQNVRHTSTINRQSNKQLQLADAIYLGKSEDLTEIKKLSRRKTRIRDTVLSGNFHLFGTLTFAPQTRSKDLDDHIRHKMILFTRKLRRRSVAYYIVAERHKSGYVHLHGLFSENLETENSPASKKYLTIPLWLHGFSSVSIIRDPVGTANYVTKYVTKEALDGKSVWTSQGLILPKSLYNVPDLYTPIISQWYGDNINITVRGQ